MHRDPETVRAALRISCAQALDLTTDYLEQALAPGDRERFEQHLRGCEPCTLYLAQIRRTIAVVGTVAVDVAVDESSMERLIRLFHDLRGPFLDPRGWRL